VGSATLGQPLHRGVIEYITRNQFFVLRKDYSSAVFRRLLPRIVFYQMLWLLYVKHGRLSAYVRGIRGVIRLKKHSKQKHHALMSKRTLDDEQLLERMKTSERQVYEWHCSQHPAKQSSLLKPYFIVFKPV